jgi:hypothetical protein
MRELKQLRYILAQLTIHAKEDNCKHTVKELLDDLDLEVLE